MNSDMTLKIVNAEDGGDPCQIQGHSKSVKCMSWHPNGTHLVCSLK